MLKVLKEDLLLCCISVCFTYPSSLQQSSLSFSFCSAAGHRWPPLYSLSISIFLLFGLFGEQRLCFVSCLHFSLTVKYGFGGKQQPGGRKCGQGSNFCAFFLPVFFNHFLSPLFFLFIWPCFESTVALSLGVCGYYFVTAAGGFILLGITVLFWLLLVLVHPRKALSGAFFQALTSFSCATCLSCRVYFNVYIWVFV